jgi:hypothetical protein
MAFFDDRKFLLSHIRHSFITCDDTGICEMAMLNEIMPHHLPSETDAEFLNGMCVSDCLLSASSSEFIRQNACLCVGDLIPDCELLLLNGHNLLSSIAKSSGRALISLSACPCPLCHHHC